MTWIKFWYWGISGLDQEYLGKRKRRLFSKLEKRNWIHYVTLWKLSDLMINSKRFRIKPKCLRYYSAMVHSINQRPSNLFHLHFQLWKFKTFKLDTCFYNIFSYVEPTEFSIYGPAISKIFFTIGWNFRYGSKIRYVTF